MLYRSFREVHTIRGVIKIHMFDFDGTVLSIFLKSEIGNILIYDNKVGEQLIRSVEKTIYASGIIWTDPGLEVFEIKDFKYL